MSNETHSRTIELAEALFQEATALRRRLHRIPETAWQETKTSQEIKKFLKKHRINYREIAGTGILGEIESGKGKCVAIRSDLDALPIAEETNLSFKSEHPGRMHACGHDVHMATASAAAAILCQMKKEFQGTVKIIYQPAEEEPPGGAIEMVRAGVLEGPAVDMIFGFHVSPTIRTGKIGIREGAFMAGNLDFDIEITGQGGHAALPHKAADPIVCASALVTTLQAIVSRQIDPLEPAVISVGKIEGGSARNVISPSCKLFGTARGQNAKLLSQLKARIGKVSDGVAKSYGCRAEVRYFAGYPPLINHPEANGYLRRASNDLFGRKSVEMINQPLMGGEDFARYLQYAPGAMFFLGVGREDKKLDYGWHHPRFNPEEAAISYGAAILAQAALRFLNA